mgnify:FL=1
MTLACGCKNIKDCYHGPCTLGRPLRWCLTRMVINSNGHIRLVESGQLLYHPDGSVSVRS